MLRLGFTGTRRAITASQHDTMHGAFVRNRGVLIHGDCVGADSHAHLLAEARGWQIEIYPPDQPRLRAFCRAPVIHHPLPYLERNRAIVEGCHKLLAVPDSPTERWRSGTWSTVRYARRLWREIWLILPDGQLRVEPSQASDRPAPPQLA